MTNSVRVNTPPDQIEAEREVDNQLFEKSEDYLASTLMRIEENRAQLQDAHNALESESSETNRALQEHVAKTTDLNNRLAADNTAMQKIRDELFNLGQYEGHVRHAHERAVERREAKEEMERLGVLREPYRVALESIKPKATAALIELWAVVCRANGLGAPSNDFGAFSAVALCNMIGDRDNVPDVNFGRGDYSAQFKSALEHARFICFEGFDAWINTTGLDPALNRTRSFVHPLIGFDTLEAAIARWEELGDDVA